MYFEDEPGTKSDLARSIAAEARARLAVERISGKVMAAKMGVSQNYLSKRLRDAAPFTFDDISLFMDCLDTDEDVIDFINSAYQNNSDRILGEMLSRYKARQKESVASDSLQGPDEWALAADTSEEEPEQ